MPADLHYGKYRALVADNQDPQGRLRIQITFPDGSLPGGWAEASLPAYGSWPPLTLPPIGAFVWIEFEEGDPARPIYTGRIVDASSPAPAAEGGALLDPSSLPLVEVSEDGGLSLRVASGASIHLGAAGIVLDNGKGAHVELAGPTISLNRGALEID
jgi:hypothetical protein